MKPRTLKKSGDIAVNPKKEKGKGTAIWYQDRYQLAPAVTKNAPARNLRTSFQMLFIETHSKHSYYRLGSNKKAPFDAICGGVNVGDAFRQVEGLVMVLGWESV